MTESLLRPSQIDDLTSEQSRIESALRDRPEMIQDKPSAQKQLRNIKNMLDTQAPKPFADSEKDGAVKRKEQLEKEIVVGMLSDEEMRACPPGAISQHTKWERENKERINEWKKLQLRLNYGTDDHDVANIEKLRPQKSHLNMQNSLVEKKKYFMPEQVGAAVVLSDEDLTLIKARAPESIYSGLALMDAEGRSIVKAQYITNYVEPKKHSSSKK